MSFIIDPKAITLDALERPVIVESLQHLVKKCISARDRCTFGTDTWYNWDMKQARATDLITKFRKLEE